MKQKLKYHSILFLSFFILNACSDIFEEEITSRTVKLLSPAENAISKKLFQQFSWEAIDGAREYRVQIASPAFERPDNYYLDTVVRSNSFGIALEPGSYQWQVKGMNAGYETPFSIRHFTIDSSASLNDQHLQLFSPDKDTVSGSTELTFRWLNLPMADKYIFQILTPVRYDTILATNRLRLFFPITSQTYTWKVTALNSNSLKESAIQKFTIDITGPSAPNLLFPRQDTLFNQFPVTLAWKRTSSDVSYDSLFLFYNNQVDLVPGFPKKVNSDSFILTSTNTNLSPGSYFWAVKSIDKVGNRGVSSLKRRFVKQ